MIKLIALLKRKPGMTRKEFADRWLKEHVKLSAKMPGLRGYRINIAVPQQPEGLDAEPIYDGTAELWWDSLADMEAAFESEIGKAAGADADQFTQLRIHIYTEENDVLPGPKSKPTRRRTVGKKKPAARQVTRARRKR